jgi:hypothetical protein
MELPFRACDAKLADSTGPESFSTRRVLKPFLPVSNEFLVRFSLNKMARYMAIR